MFQYPLPWHGGGGGDSMVYPWSTSGGGACGAGGGGDSCTLGAGGAGTGICMPGESGWIPSLSQSQPGCMGSNDMGLIPICIAPSIPPDI